MSEEAEAPVEPTPTQSELDKTAESPDKNDAYIEGVEIAMNKNSYLKAENMPLQAKLGHMLALVVTSVIALFVAATLADGRSVIALRPTRELPRLTAYKYKKYGLDYRADELLGPSYGVGLHHDSSGFTWTEAGAVSTLQKYIDELGLLQVIAAVPSVIATDGLKHPVHFLQCHQLKMAGQSAMGLAIVAEVVAALMITFHGLALLGLLSGLVRAKLAKMFAVLIWLTLTAGFLIVICVALAVMETTWECENDFIPTIKLSDHFYFTYGIGFGYAGYVSSLLVLVVMSVFTSTSDGDRKIQAALKAPTMKATLLKVGGGLVAGILVCVVCSLAVAGGLGAFEAPEEPDPNFNYCAGQKPYHAAPGDSYFKNVDCMKDGIVQVLEQSGANVTKGYQGDIDAGEWRVPITQQYKDTELCAVNVHWHLGAEHLSVGQYDDKGKGPAGKNSAGELIHRRRLAGENKYDKDDYNGSDVRLGGRCHFYNKDEERFTKEFDWKHCEDTHVGETYEVHWPHSAAGACGTKWQYQSPFYDGVFCKDGIINILTPLNTYEKIGVQAQVFTIVNDEEHYYGDLFHGMIVDATHGVDMAMYTGSTTGTSRNADTTCSRYTPITWQVDRKCHLISASSFDQMCKMMKDQADDMKMDLHPHGAREVVDDEFVANNQVNGKWRK